MNSKDKLILAMPYELKTIRELLIKNNLISRKDYFNTIKENIITSEMSEDVKEEMLKIFEEEPK